ncbi:MAG: biosynthetic arginine decarboxylase [Pseudomonadota bacterium]
MTDSATHWTANDAAELYGIERWANDYFSIDAQGHVCARTLHASTRLSEMVEGMIERDLQMPVLLRIENHLDAQIFRLNEAFKAAIEELGYNRPYRGVYPIKVNQQAQVIEEIADFGARYQHGFEVGSKPEMIVALATLQAPDSLIICNGYKDEEFIELGLQAMKLGYRCFFVLETPTELPIILRRSDELNVEPMIGVRVKMTTHVSGHWNKSSGDRSKFGLSTAQLIHVVDALKQANKLHCLKLLHCHLGSQIPNIQEIRAGITEACRFYADLVREGAALDHIDLGGGLAVDYTGWASNDDQSRNYTLEQYCTDIVDTLKTSFDQHGIAHPTIVTESGRATIAYSSVLLFNVLDTTRFEALSHTASHDEEHPTVLKLRNVLRDLSVDTVQESFNDAHYYRDEIRELFRHGQVDLRERACAENLFFDVLQNVAAITATMERVPTDLEDLGNSLADIYYGNFSLFQSLPDVWAIEQLFPIMPIHRLHERPDRKAVLADITCDSDGKIDAFIGDSDTASVLPVHSLKEGEEYYLGVFLIGAYQETLGDLHNLFGDTNVVSVRITGEGTFEFVKEIHGDTIKDVLSYVEYNPKELLLKYRNIAERAVRSGRITAKERQVILNTFNDSLQGYTYYERDAQ